jgi:hypothetical protein
MGSMLPELSLRGGVCILLFMLCSASFTTGHATTTVCKTADGTLFFASKVVANTFFLALQACDLKVVNGSTEKTRRGAGEIIGETISILSSISINDIATNVGHEAQQLSLYDTVGASKLISEAPFPRQSLIFESKVSESELTELEISASLPSRIQASIVRRKNSSLAVGNRVAGNTVPENISPQARYFAAKMHSVAEDYDIDPLLLHAIAHVESRHNPDAISPAGALGLMQVMPATARRFGVNDPERELHDPLVNLKASSAYLKTLQGLFGNDLPLVLAAYNAGEGAVIKYDRQIPPYRETQAYVRDVMDRYKAFKGLR